MGLHEELATLTGDPAIRRLAERRAGSRELGEDALHEAYCSVARVKNPESIRDLRAFFCTSLIHEINHQRTRAVPVPVEDVSTTAEQGRAPSSIRTPPGSVETEASLCLLADMVLTRLEHDRNQLLASVPARSPDYCRYRIAIVAAAKTILLLLLEGAVTSADWNAVLQSEYPQWCGEPGLARDAIDQRLSRARQDVRQLLQTIIPRHELAY
jgi:DNA-directed RNA polymerase specialized sigma24 family protein